MRNLQHYQFAVDLKIKLGTSKCESSTVIVKIPQNQMHTRIRQIFFLSLPFLFKLSKLVIYCKYFCQFRWWSLAHWKASVHKGRVCLLNKGWEMFRVKNEKTRKNVFSEWPRRIFLRFVLFKCSTGN